jgi:LuxR family maltose regulon positive regulatory protein
MTALPTGTVTFLFTDIERSAMLWERHPQAMPQAIARHDAILHDAVERNSGVVFKTIGDAVCAAFARAPAALAAALAAQRALRAEPWAAAGLANDHPQAPPLRVRMALHTGAVEAEERDYHGPPLNRAARLLAAGHGGQILLSNATAELVSDALPPSVTLRDLGEQPLKDLSRPERIFQAITPDLPADFPPLRTQDTPGPRQPAPAVQLLATKLYAPPARPTLVARPRLTARLNAGMRSKLTLLAAPAGFGKTTLLAEWIAKLKIENEELRKETNSHTLLNSHFSILNSVAWVSLDAADNDPARFWTYVITALDSLPPPAGYTSIGQHALAMLHSPQPPPIESTLIELINALATLPYDAALILDDYHVITAQPIHNALAFLLDHLPPRIHLIITSRIDPLLPLARLRARGELVEVRAADLRFTPDEAAAFLREAMGLDLPSQDIAALDARTEGWIAGLQLAALSMHGLADTHAFVAAFSGSHRHIVDYLAAEVLGRQPAHIQAFLLQTSILDRMCGPLCDALLGLEAWDLGLEGDVPVPSPSPQTPSSSAYSQLILNDLERANLFLIPLDAERHWYRYHHLLADVLRQRLQHEHPAQLAKLHHRAAEWFDRNGLIDEAIQHALAAGDPDHAALLIDRAHPSSYLGRGEMATVQRWLDALPEDALRARPALCLARARVLVRARQMDAAERWLEDAERARAAAEAVEDDAESARVAFVRGEAAAVRAFLAIFRRDMPRAIDICTQALEQVPESEPFARASLYLVLGNALLLVRDWDAASAAYAAASEYGRASGNIRAALIATVNRGNIQLRAGKLNAGVALYREAIALAAGPSGRPLPTAHVAYAALANVLREWNDLERADAHCSIALELASQSATTSVVPEYYSLQARIRQARGDHEGALAALREGRELVHKRDQPQQINLLGATEALLRLQQGDDAAAANWAGAHDPQAEYPHEELRLAHEWLHLVYVRVQIAQGQAGAALQILARLLPEAEQEGRSARVSEMAMLQALALAAQGDVSGALKTLERSLALAQPGDHLRLFVDEGAPMAALLAQVAQHGASVAEYARRLLDAFPDELRIENEELRTPAHQTSQFSILNSQFLAEPLTERELEVLRLLAAGMSSPEIAQHFVVSINTVKTQIKSIYSKLDVHSREDAIAKARALGLLA